MAKLTHFEAIKQNILGALQETNDDLALKTGRAIVAWNAMQDTLGVIFADIVSPSRKNMAFAIWYSQESDRSQRKMLQAAAGVEYGIDSDLYKEVKWICRRADALSDARNNVAHVGYTVALHLDDATIKVRPKAVGHFSRADAMSNKDIMKELDAVEKNAKALTAHVLEISPYLSFPDQLETLPERPSQLKSKVPVTPKTSNRRHQTK